MPDFWLSRASWHRWRINSPSFFKSESGFSSSSASPATASSRWSGDENLRKLLTKRRISASVKPLTPSLALTRGRPRFFGRSSPSDASSLISSESSEVFRLRRLALASSPLPAIQNLFKIYQKEQLTAFTIHLSAKWIIYQLNGSIKDFNWLWLLKKPFH